jgi:hypothetical protein
VSYFGSSFFPLRSLRICGLFFSRKDAENAEKNQEYGRDQDGDRPTSLVSWLPIEQCRVDRGGEKPFGEKWFFRTAF